MRPNLIFPLAGLLLLACIGFYATSDGKTPAAVTAVLIVRQNGRFENGVFFDWIFFHQLSTTGLILPFLGLLAATWSWSPTSKRVDSLHFQTG